MLSDCFLAAGAAPAFAIGSFANAPLARCCCHLSAFCLLFAASGSASPTATTLIRSTAALVGFAFEGFPGSCRPFFAGESQAC